MGITNGANVCKWLFCFFNMYTMPVEISLALWLLGPMTPSNTEVCRGRRAAHQTHSGLSQRVRTWTELCEPCALEGRDEFVLQAHHSMKNVARFQMHFTQWFYSASNDNISVWLLSHPSHCNVWSRCRTKIVYLQGKKILNRPMNLY